MNERGDWEAGEDLFEKLAGVSGGGGGSEEDSSDDDSDDGSGSDENGKEKKEEEKGPSAGGFYEGPEACREFLGEDKLADGGV